MERSGFQCSGTVGVSTYLYLYTRFSLSMDSRLLWKHVKTLHSLGVHHHDLQPRNVAKGRDGNLRLLDYERSSVGGGSCSCEELSTLEEIFDSLADWRQ